MWIFETTLPETNMAPEIGWLEDNPFLLGQPLFSGATQFYAGLQKTHTYSAPALSLERRHLR